jgi:hypothetical protein
MNQIKIDAFLSMPPSANDAHLSKLLENIQAETGAKVQLRILGRDHDLFKEYNLTRTPAVVIGEIIKIMGFVPSKESILSALRDLGV